jgi:transcriptional regulator with XRE-family HTH domain
MAQRLCHRRKKELELSLEVVAARLPDWMAFDHSKLARVERDVRNVTYAELREIAIALETTIGELDAFVSGVLDAGKQPAPRSLPAKLAKRKK